MITRAAGRGATARRFGDILNHTPGRISRGDSDVETCGSSTNARETRPGLPPQTQNKRGSSVFVVAYRPRNDMIGSWTRQAMVPALAAGDCGRAEPATLSGDWTAQRGNLPRFPADGLQAAGRRHRSFSIRRRSAAGTARLSPFSGRSGRRRRAPASPSTVRTCRLPPTSCSASCRRHGLPRSRGAAAGSTRSPPWAAGRSIASPKSASSPNSPPPPPGTARRRCWGEAACARSICSPICAMPAQLAAHRQHRQLPARRHPRLRRRRATRKVRGRRLCRRSCRHCHGAGNGCRNDGHRHGRAHGRRLRGAHRHHARQ